MGFVSHIPEALHTKSWLTMRAPDLGYAPRFLSFFLAWAGFRFAGESTLPPQAGTDYCTCQVLRCLGSGFIGSKTESADQGLSAMADFLLLETIIFLV